MTGREGFLRRRAAAVFVLAWGLAVTSGLAGGILPASAEAAGPAEAYGDGPQPGQAGEERGATRGEERERAESGLPVDPLTVPRGAGGVTLVLGVDVSPGGFEAAIPHGTGWTRYVQATAEAGLHLGARLGLGRDLTLAFGWRASLVHRREAVEGGEERESLTGRPLRWTGAALEYETPRSTGGHALGVSLQVVPGAGAGLVAGVELGVSLVRDPAILFGAAAVEPGGAPGAGRAIRLSAGLAFVANERVALRGTAALRFPTMGVQEPSGVLLWRIGYLMDPGGSREMAVYGGWSTAGDRLRMTLGVEWAVRVGQD